MKGTVILWFVLFLFNIVNAQTVTKQDLERFTPLQLASFVADKVVDNTHFGYEYTLQPLYADIEFINFGNNNNDCIPGVSYAVTVMLSEIAQVEEIEVGRTGALKIWINGQLVFSREDHPDFQVEFDEKTYILPDKFTVNLHKGENEVLIKSDYDGHGDWLVLLQSKNLGRYADKGKRIRCTLSRYAPKIHDANWLILGTFDGNIHTVLEPEEELVFYRLYHSGDRKFTWNIPRSNLLVSNRNGGKFFDWSYHVGCFMWGLQKLSHETGDEKYVNFADKWCEFVLSSRQMVEYQTRELHAVRSMNFGIAGRPMLDYTSAPAMAFVTRLAYGRDFPAKEQYKTFSDSILSYLIEKQFRFDGVFARTYTVEPSIWADDMFMGLPYLIYSAKTVADQKLSGQLLNDAAKQVIIFSSYLQNLQDGLFMQACYPQNPDFKTPYWSRGNGWALWATSEVLMALPKNHTSYGQLLSIFKRQIDALVACQNSDGTWNNVLDMDNSVKESSGTAIFTLCLARGINEGWLYREKYSATVESAWKALRSFVDENGDFNGVKGGTNFSDDPMDYERTPLIQSDTHGLLPLIFACMEMERYYKSNH